MEERDTAMKYVIVIIALLVGLVLALSPMIFAGSNVHADRLFHAQWAGFILLALGAGMGFKAITPKDQPDGN